MQRTRDSKIALEGTTEQDRLRMIAWEVKIRTQPVVFVVGDSTLNMTIFTTHDGSSVQVLEGDEPQELVVEDDIIDGKGIAILENLPLRKLTKEEKDALKKEVIRKYKGKVLSKKELNSTLDSIEADLISLLVREQELVLIKRDNKTVEIMLAEEFEKYIEQEPESQSLVIFPEKQVKEK